MVRIKTLIDIITNSSSEVFLIKNEGRSDEEILKLLKDINDYGCSGMGGEMSVCSNNLPIGLSIIDIDWNKKECMSWILNNLFVLDIDCVGNITRDKSTNRVLDFGGSDKGGIIMDLLFTEHQSLQELKEFISELSWKKGEKYLIKNDYLRYYCPKYGYSEYNIDLSPEDNINTWIKDYKIKREKLICELNL